jgi:hypothetical protein
MENSLILAYLPNWNRFSEKYNPDPEFVEAFFSRLSIFEDLQLQENICKRINIELGMLLLHDIEITHEMFSSILGSIGGNIREKS